MVTREMVKRAEPKLDRVDQDLAREGFGFLMSIADTQRLFGVSRRTVERWIEAGRIEAIQSTPSGAKKVRRAEIARCLIEWAGGAR